MNVAIFPEPLAFRNWKAALRQEVAAASGRPDPAFAWFQEVDRKSFLKLADPGDFSSLDTKLAAGLIKAARGELGRQISVKGQAMAKAGKRINKPS